MLSLFVLIVAVASAIMFAVVIVVVAVGADVYRVAVVQCCRCRRCSLLMSVVVSVEVVLTITVVSHWYCCV